MFPVPCIGSIISFMVLLDCLSTNGFPARLEMPGTTSELLHLFQYTLTQKERKRKREERDGILCRGNVFLPAFVLSRYRAFWNFSPSHPPLATPLHVCPAFQHHTGGGVGLFIPVALAASQLAVSPNSGMVALRLNFCSL